MPRDWTDQAVLSPEAGLIEPAPILYVRCLLKLHDLVQSRISRFLRDLNRAATSKPSYWPWPKISRDSGSMINWIRYRYEIPAPFEAVRRIYRQRTGSALSDRCRSRL